MVLTTTHEAHQEQQHKRNDGTKKGSQKGQQQIKNNKSEMK